jgi:hypothetical protein
MAEPLPTYYDALQVEAASPADRVAPRLTASSAADNTQPPDQMPGNANACAVPIWTSRAINAAAHEVLSGSPSAASSIDRWIVRAEVPADALAAA